MQNIFPVVYLEAISCFGPSDCRLRLRQTAQVPSTSRSTLWPHGAWTELALWKFLVLDERIASSKRDLKRLSDGGFRAFDEWATFFPGRKEVCWDFPSGEVLKKLPLRRFWSSWVTTQNELALKFRQTHTAFTYRIWWWEKLQRWERKQCFRAEFSKSGSRVVANAIAFHKLGHPKAGHFPAKA